MVATASVDTATRPLNLAWSWVWDEGSDGKPLQKIYFRYVDANDVVRYKKLKAGYDDGAAWIEPIRAGGVMPCQDDLDVLLEEIEKLEHSRDTEYYVKPLDVRLPEPRTLHAVIEPKAVATQIRDSAACVLRVALQREGIAATAEQIDRLARELGNNCATTLCAMDLK